MLDAVTDDDRVFRALADPTRRFLLDRLFARDGRTLTELESELEMTRFGVMKADPPRRLVQTWHALWGEDVANEPPTRVTYDIAEDDGGVTRLTVTHELENAPIHAAQIASLSDV